MKILHIAAGLDAGGVEKLLWEYCSRIQSDDSSVIFDFVTHEKTVGLIEKKLLASGNKVFYVTPKSENIFRYIREICIIMKNGQYYVVHCHQGYTSFLPMLLAFMFGVKCRIAHTHMAYISKVSKLRRPFTFLTKLFATELFACSNEAAKWTWGANTLDKVIIMKNAINIKLYLYNDDTRRQISKKLGLEGKFVVGNIGRLLYQKNHKFLIEIFSEIKKLKKNAILLLIGNGDLKSEIKEQIKVLNLDDSVIFLESVNDAYNYYNIMDVFVLPSRYEGLGIVNIEAQANGLLCFASEGVIPKDAKVSELLTFVPLDETAESWAREIISHNNFNHKENMESVINDAGYSIDNEWIKLKKFYYNAVNK
ncbi:putative glycosyltransferase EpsF [bioreactor metagenome]|uniref:Putative glycosyltransferase EpsF n=1 Tax=bioreactor metagenome TaxID=1076179 RepID=A0A644Z7H9_9ZZZZ|nr:glycosyltransferase family 1 protein [Candidatus Metalachnospira sp.]